MEVFEELIPSKRSWGWTSVNQLQEVLNEFMPVGMGFRSFIRPDGVVNLEQEYNTDKPRFKAVKHPIKAGWFALAESMDIPVPAIVNWEPRWLNEEDSMARMEKMRPMMHCLETIGLRVHTMRIAGSAVQMYCSQDSEGVDIFSRLLMEKDESIHPGKLLKRLSILSPSEGACYNVGNFATKTGRRINMAIDRNRPQADGALWISYQFARELCGDCDIPWEDGEMSRLQVWILSEVGMVKGMASIGSPLGIQTYDLIAPKESIDTKICIKRGTLIKAVSHRLDEHPSTFQAFDGLLRMPELVKHMDINEVLEKQSEWLRDRDILESSLIYQLEDVDLTDLEDDELEGKERRRLERIISQAENRVYQEAARDIMRKAGASAFAMPEIMEQATGRTLRSYTAKRARWRDNDSGRVMPGVYVSCLRGYWSDPHYSGVEEPEFGFLGFIWKGRTIDGFVMNGDEMLTKDIRYRSDGGDLDDLLDVVLLYTRWEGKEDFTPMAWVVRNPTSWGGGWFLRVKQEDWITAIENGYKAYTLTDDYEIIDLADIMLGPNPPGLKVKYYETEE